MNGLMLVNIVLGVIMLIVSMIIIVNLFTFLQKKYFFFVPKEPDQLHEWLPWHAMLPDGIIVNRDGSFQSTIKYRGPDLDSATVEELNALTFQVNNTFKRLHNGWAIYCENQRKQSVQYGASDYFPDQITHLIDEERKEHFSTGNHFESEYYLTFVYLPPAEAEDKVREFFINDETSRGDSFEKNLTYFMEEVERSTRMLKNVFSDVDDLNEDQTLTYLHSTISPKWHSVRLPKSVEPTNLSEMLVDTQLIGGTEPMLGNYHVRVISILSYPTDTWTCIFDELNRLNFRYRWVSRFLFMDRQEALSEVEKYQKGWFAKRQKFGNRITEYFSKTPTDPRQEDSTSVAKSEDAAAAMAEIERDIAMYGRYTTSIVILDTDENTANENAKTVENIINELGFEAVIEDWNAVHAWFGSIPGMCSANVRRPLMSTINLAHMLPISAVWAGPQNNKHLNGPVQIYTETHGNTPFRLSFYTKPDDLGHGIIIGPPGMGKSVLLGLLAAQSRKYENAQVFIFDKGGSSNVLTMGVGGQRYDLGAEESTISFQPLSNIDNEKERRWALEWLQANLSNMKKDVTAKQQEYLWDALNLLANSPKNERTMTGLYFHVLPSDPDLADGIKPFTNDGPFGKLFDNDADRLEFGRWQMFEMETLMSMKSIVAPTLSYLFHQIEKRLTGEYPTFIFIDEGWTFFAHEVFAEQIKKWLKELRKAKASVVFATQSLDDVVHCKIGPTILDTCPTKIFLPNSNAVEKETAAIYESFGLNQQEIQMIAHATPKEHYYYKSDVGSRLFKLALGPVAAAYCTETSKEAQGKAQKLYDQYGAAEFNQRWLQAHNVSTTIASVEN